MLGIVIVNYNTWELTLKCIDSIKKNTRLEYKVYVVDNGSTNDSYINLKEYYNDDKSVEIILSKENLGYSSGANLGIDACILDNIQYAVITNNDIFFNKYSIDSMYKFIINNSDVVIVGPKVFDINSNLMTSSYYREPNLLQYLNILSTKNVKIDENLLYEPICVYSVSGCCFTIDINKFKKMGAFDKDIFMYNEESTLAEQSIKNNFKIVFLPESTIIHNHGSTTGRVNLFIEAEQLKSGIYYWKKFKSMNNIKIGFLFLFFTLKTMIKILLGRVSSKGFKKYIKDITSYFVKIITTTY